MEHAIARLNNLEKALNRFKESIDNLKNQKTSPLHEIARDSVIKRFEFCVDIFWKCLKDYLEIKHGIKVASPKFSFRESLTQKIINQEEFKLLEEMIEDRNDTTHRYDEEVAEEISEEAEKYHKLMKTVCARLT